MEQLGQNEMFCRSCGNVVKKEAEICPKCGVRTGTGDGKSWVVAVLLCAFLGCFGIHRVYSGHTVIGVIQLLTFGGCAIWTCVDFILILVGAYKDVDGNPLVKK
jgi:TM2 domain-containing membrane protein YozV